MADKLNKDSIRLSCTCGSMIHTLQLDMFEDEGGQVCLSISYYPTTFFEKVKMFIKWLRGYDSLVADVVLSEKDMDALLNFYLEKKMSKSDVE